MICIRGLFDTALVRIESVWIEVAVMFRLLDANSLSEKKLCNLIWRSSVVAVDPKMQSRDVRGFARRAYVAPHRAINHAGIPFSFAERNGTERNGTGRDGAPYKININVFLQFFHQVQAIYLASRQLATLCTEHEQKNEFSSFLASPEKTH